MNIMAMNDFSSSQQAPSYQQIYYSDTSFRAYNEQPLISITDFPSLNICQINWVQPISRRRRQRTVFTQSNIQQLDSVFVLNQYPDIELREILGAQIGVSESRIQVWFKNRRTRARTAQRHQRKISDS